MGRRSRELGFCGCLVLLSLCCACKPTLHGRCVYEACLLELELTSREHCEIGNAADAVLCCQAREPFSIDLHHNCTPGEVSGGLCHVRCRHTARSAPGSPEVRQNRNLALANDLVELLFIDFDGFAYCLQLRFAGSAFANIGKVFGGDAIGSTARRAISNQRHKTIVGCFSAFIWHTFRTSSARKSL
jgi:hypothetical protein